MPDKCTDMLTNFPSDGLKAAKSDVDTVPEIGMFPEIVMLSLADAPHPDAGQMTSESRYIRV